MSNAAYEAGRLARRHGTAHDANPFNTVVRVTAAGTKIYAFEDHRSAWFCGWRDENDALHIAKHGNPQLGDFVQRKSKRRRRG